MKKHFLNIFPYIALVLMIVLPWFFQRGGLFFTDMVWGPQSTIFGVELRGYYDIFEKFYIAFVFAIVLFGGWRIAKSLTGDKAIIFLASAFALFNPFVYDRAMYGQFGIVLAYGLFLASFGYLIKTLSQAEDYTEPRGRFLLLSAVFAGLAISRAPHFVFLNGLVYFVFLVLILFKEKRGKIPKILGFFLLSGLVILVINFNLVKAFFVGDSQFGEFVTTGITQQDLEIFKTRGDNFFEVAKNIVSMTGFWGSEQFRYASPQGRGGFFGLSFYLLLFPILVLGFITGFKSKEEKKFQWGLIFIYLVVFILTIGIALPVARQITLWLFDNIPFYSGLREPQKWVAVIVAVYEVLFAIGLKKIFQEQVVLEYKKIAVFLFTVFVIAQAQLLIWGAFGQVKSVQYPKDWYEVNEVIKSESYKVESRECDGKILFLPWHLYMSFNWIGNIVNMPAQVFFDCPVISGTNMEAGGIYDNSLDQKSKKISAWILAKGKTDLLENNEFSIDYVVLAKEVDWQNYGWLDENSETELFKETTTLKVYRVKN